MKQQILEMKKYKAVKLIDPKHPGDYVIITKSVKPYKRTPGDLQATMFTTDKGKPRVVSDKGFPDDWEQAIKFYTGPKWGFKVKELKEGENILSNFQKCRLSIMDRGGFPYLVWETNKHGKGWTVSSMAPLRKKPIVRSLLKRYNKWASEWPEGSKHTVDIKQVFEG